MRRDEERVPDVETKQNYHYLNRVGWWFAAIGAVLFVFWTSPGFTFQEEDVGFVLEISPPDSKWLIDYRRINEGDKIPAGVTIRPEASNARGSSISICLYTGELLKTDSKALDIPKHVEVSRISRMWSGIRDRYRGRTVSAISRGDGENLQEGVVKLSDGKVDLSPIFKNMNKGAYLLRFQHVTKDSAGGGGVRVRFNWEPTKSSPLSVSGVAPGFYRLSLLDTRTTENEPTGIYSWVLISKAEEYDKVDSLYKETVEMTNKWGNEVSREAVRGFLRASLELLADQSEK